jgi:DNA-binding NtrC family response regulator
MQVSRPDVKEPSPRRPMVSRILIVSHDAGLRFSRSELLTKSGYVVETAPSAETAMHSMATSAFDLVLVGRNSLSDRVPIDKQLREKYPSLLILKIVDLIDQSTSFANHMTDAVPENVIAALKGMLG